MLRISAYSSRELQAVIVALKSCDRDARKRIRQETKAMVDPAWRQALAEHASTRLEHRVLVQTGRVAVSDQNVTLKSASVGRRLPGGLNPKTGYHAVEFGAANRGELTGFQQRSRAGRTYSVRRRTGMMLRPRNPKGYVVYPAAANVIPRLMSLWVQTVARTVHEAFEGR